MLKLVGKALRLQLAALLMAVLAAGPAQAADMVIKKVDCERWPTVEVEAALPEAGEKAARYSLRLLPEGEAVPAAALSPAGAELPPLNIVVAVDISKSLPPANLKAAQKALAAYAASLPPDTRIAVLAFNDDVRIVAPFALDRALMESALGELKPGGAKTELYRAMLYGLGLLKDQKGRRMLLVISDGHDEGTRVTIAQVIEEARQVEAGISAIGLAAKGERARRHLPVLEGFARDTGGLYRFGESPAEIAGLPYEIMSARKKTDEGRREHLYRLEFKLPESTLISRKEVPAVLTRSLDDRSQSRNLTLKPPAEAVAAGALKEKAAESRTRWLGLGGGLAGLLVLALALMLWRRRRAGGGQPDTVRLSPAGRTVAMDEQPRSRATEALAGPSLVLEFADLGLSFPLADGRFSLGARPGSDIEVDEPTVSGRHAELEISSQGSQGSQNCRVTDLDSTNGTLVNGVKIGRPTPLEPGDTLAFGNARAVLRLVRPAGR